MSGHWPPEWEEPEDEFPGQAEQLDPAVEAQLSEVSAYLSSVPVPDLPEAFETRIYAALAAEAATREVTATRVDHAAPADASRTLGSKGVRARLRRRQGGGGPRRDYRSRSTLVTLSLVVCVVFAALGFALSQGSSPTYSSAPPVAGGPAAAGSSGQVNAPLPSVTAASAGSGHEPRATTLAPAGAGTGTGTSSGKTSVSSSSATAPAPSASSSSASAAASASASSSSASAPAPSPTPAPTRSAPAPTIPVPSPTASVSFVVTASGTKYEAATLAAQVQARLNAGGGAGNSPTATLQGCVSSVTGGQSPRLVDLATYQGSAAYIIATSSQAWVVGTGCTASDTELVTSVSLAD